MSKQVWNWRLSSFSNKIPDTDLNRVLTKEAMRDRNQYKVIILLPCSQLEPEEMKQELSELLTLPASLIDKSCDKRLASVTLIVDCSYSELNSILPDQAQQDIDIKYDRLGELSSALGMRQGNQMLRGHLILDSKCQLKNLAASLVQVRHTPEEIVRLVHALNHSSKWGQVCQAGWNVGDEGIEPNDEGSKKFFNDWAKKH